MTPTGLGRQRAPSGARMLARAAKRGASVRQRRAGRAALTRWMIGLLAEQARRTAITRAARAGGSILEFGIGQGMLLEAYGAGPRLVGVEPQDEPVRLAAARAGRGLAVDLAGIVRAGLDALPFAEATFDTTLALFRIVDLADPGAGLAELVRVTKPGGEVIVVDYFTHGTGWRAVLERRFAALARALGGGPQALIGPLVSRPGVSVTTLARLPPLGLFTIVCLRREDAPTAPRRAAGARTKAGAKVKRRPRRRARSAGQGAAPRSLRRRLA